MICLLVLLPGLSGRSFIAWAMVCAQCVLYPWFLKVLGGVMGVNRKSFTSWIPSGHGIYCKLLSCGSFLLLSQLHVSPLIQCFCSWQDILLSCFAYVPRPPSLSNLRILSSGGAHPIDAKLSANKHRDIARYSLASLILVHWPRGCQTLSYASATLGAPWEQPGTHDPAHFLMKTITIIITKSLLSASYLPGNFLL